jgi:hypothetical protein
MSEWVNNCRTMPPRTRLSNLSQCGIAPGLEQLYAGTKSATLRRYGETDDKTEEVI